ncbi:hypothetical protein B0A48_17461 [Cryoendolithus antarcticus]|uniref:AAA+ ATPase domain-containing protein n=1 Tax=Cryoendolithus antarcticus TaxID=1507870 RepID=A0A1V8SCY8_9PEZI|nr:hypothetical protein B0A48_17461 [Cryoendolithus antarcticus]
MSATASRGLAITDPLVKYRALTATKAIRQDPAQHRLALHLQKLYERLKDYEPQIEYCKRLEQISRAVKASSGQDGPSRRESWSSMFSASLGRDTLALTRKLTSSEGALAMDSPKGLMLHGEVGTGKSMLVDLFADCLPNSKKRRWHFNTFMLETFAKLEALRKSRQVPGIDDGGDHSMLYLARDMIETSPILFLDEFQLPDRAASKIMTNLMTSFFQLGGVLIATSNRMPEELAKAAGMDFPAPAPDASTGIWGMGLGRRKSASRGDKMFAGQTEFAGFLDVLKARCEVWEMEGAKDYRRIESAKSAKSAASRKSVDVEQEWRADGHEDLQHSVGMPGWPTVEAAENDDAVKVEEETAALPSNFVVTGTDTDGTLTAALQDAVDYPTLQDVPWQPSALTVYGRLIPVPRSYTGVTCWTFDELCRTTLGPADYITLASTYHTMVLTDVPVLTWLMKNEARRFITLLDALYECRCKLFITAAAGPDDIFFPEHTSDNAENGDATYAETISEVYQDATAPFRPNILSANPDYAEPEPDPEPNYTHARFAGLLNADALEDDPPNKPQRKPWGRSFGRTDSELERPPIDPDEVRRRPNFTKTGAFTGEDERFAYKRAQSRLWEMCGSRWWARDEVDWHRPLPADVRRWERAASEVAKSSPSLVSDVRVTDAAMGDAIEDDSRDERSFRHVSTSPFRTATEPPPKFSLAHAWGMVKYGPKAGAWGQGVDGLKDREKDK